MVAVIDVDSLLFTAGNGNKVLNSDGNPSLDDKGRFIYTPKSEEEMMSEMDRLMNEILTDTNAIGYIAYIKGINTITKRKEINPEYKQNRPKESPHWWNFCKNYMIEKWKVNPANNYEVDDYVATTIKQVPDSFIVAIDKDLLNLEGRSYNWRKKEWKEVSKEEADYYFWGSCIIGDQIDGVPALRGKGVKFVEKLFEGGQSIISYEMRVLREYINHYGEYKAIAEFYKNYYSLKIIDSIPDFKVPEIIPYGKQEEQIKF